MCYTFWQNIQFTIRKIDTRYKINLLQNLYINYIFNIWIKFDLRNYCLSIYDKLMM